MIYLGVGLYVNNSRKAVEIYRSAFGLELGYHVLNEDGSYYHSELLKDGSPFCSVAEADEPKNKDKNPVQLGYECKTREELEYVLSILKEEGRVDMDICALPWSPCAAVVTDQFGVNWFLSLPQHRPPEDWSPAKAE